MRFTYHLLVPVAGIIFNLALLWILFLHRKNKTVQKFLVSNVFFFLWYVQQIGFYILPTTQSVDIWSRIFLLGMIGIPAVTIDFYYALLKIPKKTLVYLLWIATLLFYIINLTGGFAHDFVYYNNIKYVLVGTPIYRV
jgi:hypothetical protein